MKRIFFSIIVGLAVTVLSGCGSSSSNKNTDEDKSFSVVGEDEKTFESYQAACRAQDFEAAHKFLDHFHDEYIDILGGVSSSTGYIRKKERFEKGQAQYTSALDYVYKQEIMYLASVGDTQIANRIAFLINGIPIDGTKPQTGIVDFYEVADNAQLEAYVCSIQHINSICDAVLDIAINLGNKEMARNVLKLYKEDVYSMTGGSSIQTKDGWFDKAEDGTLVDGNHGYIKFVSTSKEAAQKKYDEAVKSGEFE